MYSTGEEKTWFSQSLLTHKDKMYGTDGFFQVSVSTYTEDYKFFGTPHFNISISNTYRKSYNFNYDNACDLLRTFEIVKEKLKTDKCDKCEVQRKYQKNLLLFVKFFVEDNNNDSVVSIQIYSNETDFTKIILPISVFGTFLKCLRYYVDNYFNICTQLLAQSIQNEAVQIIKQLPGLIKGISSQISVSSETISDYPAPEYSNENVVKTQATIEDLDRFIGGDAMSNVKIPEIVEEKIENKKIAEVDSVFTKTFLKNDLSHLEDMLNNHVMSKNVIESFTNEMTKIISSEVDDDFTALPGINEDDKKSIVYLPKINYTRVYADNYNKNVSLPSGINIFKYKASNVTPVNIDIALDLLLYNIYIKALRTRLESRITDSRQNKSIFHVQFRFFLDSLTFSILDNNIDVDQIPSLIMARFKYYDSIGVFGKYKRMLENEKLPPIIEHDISFTVNEIAQKIINISPYIEELHEYGYENGHFKLPRKNDFDLEQILNEVIPLELAESSGRDLTNGKVISDLREKYSFSDETLKFILESKPKVKKTPKPKKESTSTVSIKFNSNLERVVNFYSDEIPSQYKESFMTYVEKFKDIKFDLSDGKYPYDEFGDQIIKALYLWDPENDPKITNNYKQYQLKIQKELMEKDLILAKMKSEDNQKASSDDWNFLTD